MTTSKVLTAYLNKALDYFCILLIMVFTAIGLLLQLAYTITIWLAFYVFIAPSTWIAILLKKVTSNQ